MTIPPKEYVRCSTFATNINAKARRSPHRKFVIVVASSPKIAFAQNRSSSVRHRFRAKFRWEKVEREIPGSFGRSRFLVNSAN
jgi:hypothetical protein